MTGRYAALLALLVAGAPVEALASGLIDNVNGIATDASGRTVRFNGLLIDKDGRVEKRLQPKDKRPKALDYRYDAKGQTIIPGFVDAHADVMKYAIRLLSLDLGAASSVDDAAARTGEYIRTNAGRRWILGFGWNSAGWPAGRAPTAADLDRVESAAPVWLVDADGEQGWANSAALKLAGISAATPQPAGGRIMLAGGKPTGLLVGRAMELVERVVPRPAPKDLDLAFLKAQASFLARGITAVGDGSTDLAAWQTYRRAGDRNSLRMRIVASTASVDDLPVIAGPAPTPWLYDGRLRLSGVRLVIDGGLGARRAWLSAPYADAPETSGAALLDDTRLRNQMSRAAMDGFEVVLAAHGDRAVQEAASAIGEMRSSYATRGRWRIEGADLATAADLGAAGSDTALTIEPAAIGDGGALARARLGAAADAKAYGWADLASGRTALGFAGHGPYSPLDPLPAMRLAMGRAAPDDQSYGGWRPEERLSFGQALRAATAGGAMALGAAGRFGSLEPGDYADFLFLDRDIETGRPADLGSAHVKETWVAGQKVLLDTAKAP